MPVRNPMMRLPMIFTLRVPTGMEKKSYFRLSPDRKYLATLPINPPNPITIICFIIMLSIMFV